MTGCAKAAYLLMQVLQCCLHYSFTLAINLSCSVLNSQSKGKPECFDAQSVSLCGI